MDLEEISTDYRLMIDQSSSQQQQQPPPLLIYYLTDIYSNNENKKLNGNKRSLCVCVCVFTCELHKIINTDEFLNSALIDTTPNSLLYSFKIL